MNKLSRKFLGDVLSVLAILLLTVAAYVRLGYNPSILFAGALALTFFVAAEILLVR